MATRKVQVNLHEEVIKILKKHLGSADGLTIGISHINNDLEKDGITFELVELIRLINHMMNITKEISVSSIGLDPDKNTLNVSIKYPAWY